MPKLAVWPPKSWSRVGLMLGLAAAMATAACGNLDFGDNPGREVQKADPRLTAFPKHLTNGAVQ